MYENKEVLRLICSRTSNVVHNYLQPMALTFENITFIKKYLKFVAEELSNSDYKG